MSAIQNLMKQAERIFYGEAEANVYVAGHVFRVTSAKLSKDKSTVHCTAKPGGLEIEIRASSILAIEETTPA